MTEAVKMADEKTIQRLRDALVFDHRDRELLGPETTLRLAFAVCNKLGLIPRSTEQAEVFLNAMRASGMLTVADVNAAKWDLLGEEHSAGHTFAPVDSMIQAHCIPHPIPTSNNETDDQEVSAPVARVAHFTNYLADAAKELRKADRPWLANRCLRAAREIEELTLENVRLNGFREAFLSALSSFNLLGDALHGRGVPDED